MPWINEVLKATEESESPERYYYWSSLCVISAICSPNVYLDRFYYKLSPNIFVFLVGASGIKKGMPIDFAYKIVREVDCTKTIKGRFTIQGLVKELGKSWTNQTGVLCPDSRAFIAVGEFASSLIYDPQGITTLTDLYDTHYNEDWKNTLSTVPLSKLVKPCLTFLAASNETNLESSLPLEAIEGGFIARISIIHESKRRTINSLMYKPKNDYDLSILSNYPKELAKLNGQFNMTDDAKKSYDLWYKSFVDAEHEDKTGTSNRITDTILKVGMLIRLSKTPELLMTKDDIEESIDKCMSSLVGMKRIIISSGKGGLALQTKMVLTDLMKRYPNWMKRSNLLRNHNGDFDYIDLDRILENLDQSGAINIRKVIKDIEYQVKEDIYNQYVEYIHKKEISIQ